MGKYGSGKLQKRDTLEAFCFSMSRFQISEEWRDLQKRGIVESDGINYLIVLENEVKQKEMP